MIRFLFICIFKFYGNLVSPFMSSSCRFYPTCSDYFGHVLVKYSFFVFLYFFLKRVLKCNAFFRGGYDPSP